MDPVESYKKPPGEPLPDVVETVAGRVLRILDRAAAELPNQPAPELRQRLDRFAHDDRLDIKPVARHLHNHTVRITVYAGGKRQSDHVLASGDADFDTPAVVGFNQHRRDTTIHEI